MAGPAAPIIAGAVQGGMSIGGQLIAGYQSKKNQARTIAANKEQAEYAYAKDKEMWEQNNVYNSPQAQMQRLKEAGLNPNLVYGTGTVGNTSTQTPRYNPPNIEYNQKPMVTLENMPDFLSMYQNFEMKQAQIDNIRAQTDNTAMRTLTEDFRQNLMDIQGSKIDLDRDIALNLWPYNANIKQQNFERGTVDIDKSLQQIKNMKQDEQLKMLEQHYKSRQITTETIKAEKMAAEKLFQDHKNEWIKMGVTTSDNAFVRIMVRMMNESGIKDYKDMDQFIIKMLGPYMGW